MKTTTSNACLSLFMLHIFEGYNNSFLARHQTGSSHLYKISIDNELHLLSNQQVFPMQYFHYQTVALFPTRTKIISCSLISCSLTCLET